MSEIWQSRAVGPRLTRLALTPLSWLYAGGWEGYLAMYALGVKKAASPHQPILCIGNLQIGGSGKSPLTRHLVSVLRGMGKEVVVSCSGYGSPRSEAASVAPEGPLDPAEWGDEPAMLRWLEPDLPLIVGRRRVLAAELAHQHFPDAVMLMDDGFQHLPLRKQISIVLDPVTPFNRQCLPAGPYREPRFNRRRADLVLPSSSLAIETAPMQFINPEGEFVTISTATGYSLLCALGAPERFVEAVAATVGQTPEKAILQPDHDSLQAGNLLTELPADVPVVVTAKDWVKLRQRPDALTRNFLIATHEVRVTPPDAFVTWLHSKLNG